MKIMVFLIKEMKNNAIKFINYINKKRETTLTVISHIDLNYFTWLATYFAVLTN